MKIEDFFLTAARKAQARYQAEWEAENRKMTPSWHDLYAAQQRLRAATLVVEVMQETINEATGDTE